MMKAEKAVAGARFGHLTGADGHNATGTVLLTTDHHGSQSLRLADITVDRVPDGRVYLARNADYTKGVELGKLTRFAGTVEFPISATVQPCLSVQPFPVNRTVRTICYYLSVNFPVMQTDTWRPSLQE